jgi:hypothetical protein
VSEPKVISGKPTLEDVAWVLERVAKCIDQPCSFRYLIYDIMGYGHDAYLPLYAARGMEITNAFVELDDFRQAAKRGEVNGSTDDNAKPTGLSGVANGEDT